MILSIRQSEGLPAPLRGLSGTVALALAILFGVAVVGCGGGEGVESGATVTAYVAAPLCVEAKLELSRAGGQAGDLGVKAVCLPDAREGKKLNLATVGANARQATEDSTTVAYLESSDPRAARFTHPILESAEIAWIADSSGKTAMAQLLRAIRDAGNSSSLRTKLGEELH